MNTRHPSSTSNPAGIDDRVALALSSHRIKIRLLNSAAFLLGSLAVAASVVFVGFYVLFYLPKQKQILRDVGTVAQQSRTGAQNETVEDAIKRIDKFVGVEVTLMHVVSMGSTLLATAVGILGLGTLVLLTAVILGRRVTLHQISTSLAQISAQLRELEPGRNTGTPPA